MADKNNKQEKENIKPTQFNYSEYAKAMTANKYMSDEDIVRRAMKIVSYGGGRSQGSLTDQIKDAQGDVNKLREISNKAKSNQVYNDVISYFKTIFMFRYTVIPIKDELAEKVKFSQMEDLPQSDLLDVTNKMLIAAESLRLETTLPRVLEEGLFNGYVALYAERVDDKVRVTTLPTSHAEPFLISNDGTYTVVFDLSYFDDILQSLTGDETKEVLSEEKGSSDEEARASLMSLYPKEIQDAYLAYSGYDNKYSSKDGSRAKGPKFVNLDPLRASVIPFSSSMAPPKLKTAASEEVYDKTVEIELDREMSSLEKIFTHEIPMDSEGQPSIAMDELIDIQESLEQSLSGASDVKAVSVFGNTNLYDVGKTKSAQVNIVEDAFINMYDVAAINPSLFRANTDYALEMSLARNASYMWDILQKIMLFFNLTINEQFDFDGYRCSINLLPITQYNEKAQVEAYRRNAEYGIGILESLVASGQKQISIHDKLALEKEMMLDDLLTPLRSSHTRSAKEIENAKQDNKEEVKDKNKEKIDEKEVLNEKQE